jgi:hypothetical protein
MIAEVGPLFLTKGAAPGDDAQRQFMIWDAESFEFKSYPKNFVPYALSDDKAGIKSFFLKLKPVVSEPALLVLSGVEGVERHRCF